MHLRPRRAVDRPAPARQRAASSHARRLRDLGNTVLVVEHDEETMRAADWLRRLRAGRGRARRAQVVVRRDARAVDEGPESRHRRLPLGARVDPSARAARRTGNGSTLTILGAREHNLKNVDVTLPARLLVAVTGVSGAGKSTLVNGILFPALARALHDAHVMPGAHARVTGIERDRQGHRHRPAADRPHAALEPGTYTKAFDHDPRALRADARGARVRLRRGALLAST